MTPDLPTTSDLFDQLGDALESCHAPLRQFGAHRHVAGPIVTYRTVEDNLEVKTILREPGQGRILVIDTGGSPRVAMLGDHMAAVAAESGWAGVIVHGAVRDSQALATVPLMVKALGTNPRRSRKDGIGQRDVPVAFGGALFTPGAILVSDDDGVVVLPPGVNI